MKKSLKASESHQSLSLATKAKLWTDEEKVKEGIDGGLSANISELQNDGSKRVEFGLLYRHESDVLYEALPDRVDTHPSNHEDFIEI